MCIVAALLSLPALEGVSPAGSGNVLELFFAFLAAFIKNPFAWAGIVVILFSFREPKLRSGKK